MARASLSIEFSQSDLNAFTADCYATIRNVANGTKRATEQACKDILEESLKQVPRDTNTLANSASYEVYRRNDIKGYRYEGYVGYGLNGDPVNPKTGESASRYMVVVHEDLQANHPTGKAKFLEDPVREYSNKLVDTFAKEVNKSLSDSNNNRK